MTRICKNCAHSTIVNGYVCRKDVNLVTGDAVPCHLVRADITKCGPDGKWWEKRFEPTDSATFTVKPAPIETPQATIRREDDRPWEKDGKDYGPQ